MPAQARIIAGTMPEVLHHPAAPVPETNLVQAVRRAARNATWLFSSQTAARLIGFAMGTVLARSFGAVQFGEYMFVMTFVMYFAFLADGGLGRFLIRDASREPHRAREFLAKTSALRLVLAFAVYALMIGAALLTRSGGERTALIAIAGLSLFSGAITGALSSMFNAREEMRISALFSMLSSVTTALFVLAALAAGLGLPGVIVGAALANIPPMIYLIRRWRERMGMPHLEVDSQFWRLALRRSLPYAMLGVIGLVYFRTDALLLTWMKGAEATGIYTAAYRLLDAVTDVPGVIVAAMFPTLSRLHIESKIKVRKTYFGALATLAVLGLPVLIGMIVFARPVIHILYGDGFAGSVIVLQLLAVAVYLIFIDTANTMVLYASDNLRPVVLLSMVTMTANILLGIALIPAYAERGAAVATILSTVLSIAIFTPVVLRSLRT
jgi:O-antigen/teichoic acid export membrane protein